MNEKESDTDMKDLGFTQAELDNLEPATDEEVAEWEAGWKADADKQNERDLSIEHLTKRKAISIAKKVRTYLQGTHPYTDNGGCVLFSEDFAYTTGGDNLPYTSNDAGALLSLVMDGGGFYDIFSPNGDGVAYYGMGCDYKLEQFIQSLGYRPEWITSYCLGVYEQ